MKVCICTTPVRPEPSNWTPFGSMAIIESLSKIGINSEFYNIDYHRPSKQKLTKYFESNHFDIVGISAVVSTAYKYTKELVEIIKKIDNKTIIILGGSLAASANILHHKCKIDYCVIGDGEEIIINLVNALMDENFVKDNLKEIKGITYLDEKKEFVFTGNAKAPSQEEFEIHDYSILHGNGIEKYIFNPPAWENYGFPYKKDPKKKLYSNTKYKGLCGQMHILSSF